MGTKSNYVWVRLHLNIPNGIESLDDMMNGLQRLADGKGRVIDYQYAADAKSIVRGIKHAIIGESEGE